MPDYGWRGKTKEGKSKGLHPLDPSRQAVQEKDVPVDVSTVDGAMKARCGVEGCGKLFKAPHVIANHFRAKHKDLNTDKLAWKRYVKEL